MGDSLKLGGYFVFTHNKPEVKHTTRNEARGSDLTAFILF